MLVHHSIKVHGSFEEISGKLRAYLIQEGFHEVTTIDLKDAIQKNLHKDFRNYRILGACDPVVSFKAISLESHLGLMLVCNIVVQEHENGEIEISASNPLDSIDDDMPTPIADLAVDLRSRLNKALERLHTELVAAELWT